MLFHASGFILRMRDFRENDKTMSVYTDQFGKIEILVRGAKRLTSKLAGKCQPFVLLDLTVSPGRFYWHLIGLASRQLFREIWLDRIRLKIGSKILLAVDSYLRLEKKDLKIFKLIFSALAVLNLISPVKAHLILESFLIKMVGLLGYQPNLKSCVFCQKKDSPKLKFFHLSKGGLICETCQNKFGDRLPFSQEALKILFQMMNEKFAFWLKAPLPEKKFVSEAKEIINQFVIWHLL